MRFASVLWNMKPDQLAKHLIGGLTVAEAGIDLGKFSEFSLPAAALDDTSAFILPPLPNTLFTRDSSCWIYGGVSINPMYWPARRSRLQRRGDLPGHPMFEGRRLRVLVPAARRRRTLPDRGLRSRVAGRRRRAADRERHGADRPQRADAGPDDRADRAGRCSRRARRSV